MSEFVSNLSVLYCVLKIAVEGRLPFLESIDGDGIVIFKPLNVPLKVFTYSQECDCTFWDLIEWETGGSLAKHLNIAVLFDSG